MTRRTVHVAKKLAETIVGPVTKIEGWPASPHVLSKSLLSLGILVFTAGLHLFTNEQDQELTDEQSPYSEALAKKGEVLYRDHCASCHGPEGVGENPDEIYARDAQGDFVAPPLNGTGHSWHHTDADLVSVILNGSERNPKKRGWKDTLSRYDAVALVEHIRSLWTPEHIICQGPAHMEPECQRIAHPW